MLLIFSLITTTPYIEALSNSPASWSFKCGVGSGSKFPYALCAITSLTYVFLSSRVIFCMNAILSKLLHLRFNFRFLQGISLILVSSESSGIFFTIESCTFFGCGDEHFCSFLWLQLGIFVRQACLRPQAPLFSPGHGFPS